jgi:hypothetical protein
MARTILTELAFFIAPFAIYASVLLASLAFAGIALVAVSLVWFAHYGGYKPGTTYTPAYIDKDGKFHPGVTK